MSKDYAHSMQDDLISRHDAIDALRQQFKKSPTTAIRAMNTIEELSSTQQWVPCNERLPEKSGRYLVTRGLNACGALWNRVYIVGYSDLMGLKKEKIWWNGNVGKSDFEKYDDVIAWMPLPKAWKGE